MCDTQITRDGQYTHYSRLLGKYDDFLSCYKCRNKAVQLKTPEEWYKHFLNREKEQEEILIALQNIYFYLLEKRSVHGFGTYLSTQGIYKHKNCFASVMESAFLQKNAFLSLATIKKYKLIISIFKDKYCVLQEE